jgi:Caspase domain
MSDAPTALPAANPVDAGAESGKSVTDGSRETTAPVKAGAAGGAAEATVSSPVVPAPRREARPESAEVIRAQPANGELKVRLLTEKGEERRRDKWDKADILAKLLSGVVIAGVGLLINSSIQRGQIASSEANARAQLDAAKLKATDEKKLQEGALTAQLVQHLSSDNPTQRQIAIIALRESVPPNIYDATLAVLANSDPDKGVRLRAIENLSVSPAVAAAKALTSIAKDVGKSSEERAVAEKSSRTAALSQILTGDDEVIFAAASSQGFAVERSDIGHGVFTYSVLQGLQGKADASGDGVVDVGELRRYVDGNVEQLTDGRQTPVFASTGEGVIPLNRPRSPNSKVHAVVVGISSYADSRIARLAYPEKDAKSFAALYSTMLGAKVDLLSGPEATKEKILAAIRQVTQSLGPEDVLVFYFGGDGRIVEGQGMLVPYDARQDSPASYLRMEELKFGLKDVRHKVFYVDTCFAGDLMTATR